MKYSRLLLFLLILSLAGILSSCTGGAIPNEWYNLTVDGDTAYLAANQHVYAVDLKTGREIWRYPTEATKATFYAAPLLTKDGQLIVSGYDNVIYSLDPKTGQENKGSWPFTQAVRAYIAPPLELGDRLFAPNNYGDLYALDLSGKPAWATPFKSAHGLWATPVPDKDGKLLYVAAMDHYLYAIQAENGQVAWKTEDLGGTMVGSPALSPDGSTLFVGTFNSEMLAIDTAGGKVRNRFATRGWVWSGPALAKGVLYFGDLKGTFYALNASDLSEAWSTLPEDDKSKIAGTPLLVGDGPEHIYYNLQGSKSGMVYALKGDGSPLWSKPVEVKGTLNNSPWLAGDLLLVSPLDNEAILFALDAATGAEKWSFTPEKK